MVWDGGGDTVHGGLFLVWMEGGIQYTVVYSWCGMETGYSTRWLILGVDGGGDIVHGG